MRPWVSHFVRLLSSPRDRANLSAYASSALAPAWGFGAYILIARANDSATLTNGLAFSALTLFSLLDLPMGAIVNGSEDSLAIVNCFQRIQKHLLEKERSDRRLNHGNQTSRSETGTMESPLLDVEVSSEHPLTEPCVTIRDLSASWSVDTESVLKDLNVDIPSSQITMIVGPVGSGKSSFLRVLLGEISENSGTISTNFTNAAYCNQSPWITFGTIQENIIGGSSWNQTWYNQIIQLCALLPDFQQLPAGDQTKVGVRGSRLSGGQQMRVVCMNFNLYMPPNNTLHRHLRVPFTQRSKFLFWMML